MITLDVLSDVRQEHLDDHARTPHGRHVDATVDGHHHGDDDEHHWREIDF